MVTRSELIQQRTQREAYESQQAELKAQQAARREIARQAEDLCRVETMLDTGLGEILEAANADGFSTIRLGCNRVWRLSEPQNDGPWSQFYAHQSPLQFSPQKGYPPVTRLTKILEQAGFHVSFDTEVRQNTRMVGTADGYTLEKEPGTHIVYYLRINWAA